MSPEEDDVPWRRVVVDTNVLISAALSPQGIPAVLVDQLLQSSRLVFSRQTFAELDSRIWKPKFDRYVSMETRQSLLHDFSASAHWVDVPATLLDKSWSRDPDDDHFIRAALHAGASHLITGDTDLLCLSEIDELTICTPREALRLFMRHRDD